MARILVVEDDNDVAAYFMDAVRGAGHEGERAATSYGAALRALHGAFDLILMDLSLRSAPTSAEPLEAKREEVLQLNGIMLAAALRWYGVTVPIIIVTGGTTRVDKDMVDRAKISGVLLKPVLPRDLIPEIARHLGETIS